ncbi:unnamed protein product [Closterium sp. NIES-53]
MASLRVLAFDQDGRPVAFDTWHDDLQLYLLSDSKDSVSLFDHVSGVAPAPPATADVSTRQHRPCTTLSLLATPPRPLLLPYLFPELSAFATVADLVTHLRSSDARYHAALPAKFLTGNPPPMDQFLTLDPTSLAVHLLEQHLLVAETSAVAVGAARGTLRSPFFEGCSPSPLSPSFASTAAANVSVTEDVGAASTSAKRCNSKGKGGRGGGGGSSGGGGGSGSGGGESGRGGGGSGGGGDGGTGGGSGGSGGGGGGSGGSGGSGGMGLVVVCLDLGVEALVVVGASSRRVRARPSRPNSSSVRAKHAGGFTLSTAASPAWTTPGVPSLVTTSSALAGQSCLGRELLSLT